VQRTKAFQTASKERKQIIERKQIMKTVVALFDNFSDAQRVVRELVDEGIDRDRISLIAGDSEGRYAADLDRHRAADRTADDSTEGAATGAVIGGIGGALIGIGALAIPGVGPVVAAGPLIAGLVGAGVGAAVGGLVGALIDAGVPEEQAGYYAEGVRRGSTLVSVETDETMTDRVVGIFSRYHPVNIEERAATWRQSGWTGSTVHERPAASRSEEFRGDRDLSQPVASQRADFGSGGAYRAPETKQARTERATNGGAQAWATADSHTNRGEHSFERGSSDLSMYDADFRSHYQTHYAGGGYTYEQYEPAYRYGHTLGADAHYQGRDWRDLEEDARLYWTTYHSDSPWENFKDAIRHGWERAKQAVR
jgi:uncharacterized membrane protein